MNNLDVKLGIKIKTILLFFYCYDIVFQGTSTLFSTRKLAAVLFLIYFFISRNRTKKNIYQIYLHGKLKICYLSLICLCVFSTIYLYFRAVEFQVAGDIYKAYPYPLYFMIWVLIMPLIIAEVMKTQEVFCYSLSGATILQAIIIWFEYTSYDFKIWLTKHIFTLSNISFMARDRATGLGASGAQLTIFLSVGIFAMGYLIIKKKKNFKWILGMLWTLSASFLCGRTGTYISILVVVLTLVVLYLEKKKLHIIICKLIFCILIVFAINQCFIRCAKYDVRWTQDETYDVEEAIHHIADRTKGLGKPSGMYTANVYTAFFGGTIPEWSMDSFFGMGIIRGEIFGVGKLAHDSGYLQRTFSNGPVLALMQYINLLLFYFLLWIKIESKTKRFYILWAIISLFVIEIKEPFIYYYMPAFSLELGLILNLRERRAIDEKN